MSTTEIARICHDANRALCSWLDDRVLPPWRFLDGEMKQTVVSGVEAALANPEISPRESHANWMVAKQAAGWRYGEETNDYHKTHKCMLPYDELPPEQQAKDALFLAIVNALKPLA